MCVATIHHPNELVTAVKTNKEAAFYKTFFSFPQKVREEMFKVAGIGLDYAKKQIYVKGGAPVLRFANALKLDKASNGAFDVFLHGEGADEIDLMHLRKATNREIRRRRQARLLSAPKTKPDVLTDTP